MNIRITLLTAACALALVACGDNASDTNANADIATPPTTSETTPDTTTTPVAAADPAAAAATTPATTDATTSAQAASAPGNDKPAAVVSNCATEIEGTDAMQYNVGSITVPASCTEFTITLKHTGKLPVTAMGHNVVITRAADMAAVAADGISAGADADYVKADDARVIAHSDMVGGGETTSVSFPVSKIQGDGAYEFFCSFPGHSALMKGTIAVE